MAVYTIRATYQDGQIRLLEPADLVEGQALEVRVLAQPSPLEEVLGHLLVRDFPPLDEFDVIDEEAFLRETDDLLKDKPPVSEEMIEERRNGP